MSAILGRAAHTFCHCSFGAPSGLCNDGSAFGRDRGNCLLRGRARLVGIADFTGFDFGGLGNFAMVTDLRFQIASSE